MVDPLPLDVVFVDEPGTAWAQTRLLGSRRAFVDEAARLGARLRVAATTATVATASCETRSDAVSGRLASTSCLDRRDDFIADDGTDDRAAGTAACTHTTAEIPFSSEGPWAAT